MFVPSYAIKTQKPPPLVTSERRAFGVSQKNAKQAIIFVLTHSQSIYGTSVETCRPYPRDYMSVANYLFYRRIITYFLCFEKHLSKTRTNF